MAHYSGLRSEGIRISREDIFRKSGEGKKLHLLLSTKRTKMVASRHDFWAQNVLEMLVRPRLRPQPRWVAHSAPPGFLAGFTEPFRGREERGTGRNGERVCSHCGPRGTDTPVV